MKIRTLVICAALAASSLATAQPITDSFVYQGTLNDNGAPANGFYDITFQIHQTEIGGAASFSLTVSNIEVTDGLFEAYVNFALSGVVFDSDQTRWLELRVTEAGQPGVTILAPRQRITPAPLANYALRAGRADFATTSGTSLQDAYDNGAVITPNIGRGPIEFRSGPSQNAELIFTNELHEIRAIYGQAGSDSGFMTLYNRDNNANFRFEADVSFGGGGFAQIARNDSANPGIIFDGNRDSSESSYLGIFGTNRSILFDTSLADNLSVQLPANAINSTEILNEVGVAENSSASSLTFTVGSGVQSVASVTINAPTNGYVLVISSLELSINHIAGTTASVDIGVSTTPTGLSFNNDLETRIDANTPSGAYDHAVTTHAIFSAVAGSNTYYLNGNYRTGLGSATALDNQLSAIFIPTAYGAAGIQARTGHSDEHNPISGSLTQYDIVMEQNAALQADLTRQQRELDAMKAQMQQLLKQSNQQNTP